MMAASAEVDVDPLGWAALTQVLLAWGSPLIAFGLTFLSGWLLRAILDWFVLPGVSRAGVGPAQVVTRGVHGLLLPGSALLGLQIALSLAPLAAELRESATRGVGALLIMFVTLVAGRVVAALLGSYVERIEGLRPVASLSERITLLVIWALGLLMGLSHLKVEITPLLTTLGVAGLAAALALQDTLANFFAGLYLLADRPVRRGDYVKLDGGVEGYVTEVGWRSTKMRQLANNIVIIPNHKVAQSIITNYSLPETRMALLIPIPVAYGTEPDHVERVLLDEATKAAGEIEGLLADPPPSVRLIPGFGDSALEFTLVCQVREFVDQYLVQHELRKRVLRRFRAEKIEIPFPQRTVHLDESTVARMRSALRPGAIERDGPEA